jgi:replication factor C large subunit
MEDWTEKYRPKTLDDIVGNERAIIELRKWANSWEKGTPKKRAVILSGKPGIGKTSAAIALSNDFNWAFIEMNTSDARNATKIKQVATSGAINETFDNEGRFISSKSGGRKLIILDEADNLYEKAEKTAKNGEDFSDRGGKKAIVDTIKITSQPIILIVNDYYSLIKGSGDILKNICNVIRFYDPDPNAIFNLLRKISLREGVNVDPKVLHGIADRCKGDIRSAVNDLQSICLDKKIVDAKALDVLGFRDREKIIFDALREIFKTKNIQSIRESTLHLDEDPNSILLWVNENIPYEYRDLSDLVDGFDALSKADIFLGRTKRKQNYNLWSYACDFMNGGVAVAKTRIYPNEKYNFPTWLREYKTSKSNRDIRDGIVKKISQTSHNSSIKSKDFLAVYFQHMIRNNTGFAIKMKNKYDFSETEIKYLLGDKHRNTLEQILNSSEDQKVLKDEEEKISPIKIEKEKKENIQQSLFDF